MYRQGISHLNLSVKMPILEPKDCTAVSSNKSSIIFSFKGRIFLFSSQAIPVSLCQISKQTFKLLSEITNSLMQLIAACCYAVEISCHHMLWM